MAERGPGKWVKEDDFWKGVAVQVLGTLGAALIAYFFALGLGLVQRPEVLPLAASAGPIVVVTLIVLYLVSAEWFGRLKIKYSGPILLILMLCFFASIPFGSWIRESLTK